MFNIYYNPEAFGLRSVAGIDVAGSYEFDMFEVWTDGAQLYWATDSGCSCPVPFDEVSLSDLKCGGKKACLRAFDKFLSRDWFSGSTAGAGSVRDAVCEWKPNNR